MRETQSYARTTNQSQTAAFYPIQAPAATRDYSVRPTLPTYTSTPSENADNGLYRMLGGGRSQTYAVNLTTLEEAGFDVSVASDPRPITRPHNQPDPYNEAWNIDFGATEAKKSPRPRMPRQSVNIPPKVLAAAGVIALLVLAWALVTPAFAAGRPISRYTDPSAPQSAQADTPQAIDTSSAPATDVQGPIQPVIDTQPAPAGSYSLVGSPSISVAQIENVLRQYGSPAAGQGQKLYDLGVQYGIDPAYALAFFVHESGCGTQGVARTTHSLGNIRWTDGWDNYQGYRLYPTWEAGMEDWYKLITDLYINQWGLRTVDAIVPVYAPTGDGNNPTAYISNVEGMVDSWRGK